MPSWFFYVLAFLIYSGLILLFGYHGLDKTKNMQDFYLAGRSLRTAPSVGTFIATWFSAASMLGFTGNVYTFGISTILYSVLAWFAGLSIMLFFAGRLRKYDILTIPEFLRHRYDSRILQALTALVLLGCYLYYIAMQIRGVGIVISNFLDVPYAMAILFAYVFVLYTTFGGMYSVVRTDSLHVSFIIIGTAGLAWLVIDHVGGLRELFLQTANVAGAPLFNFRETSPGAMLDPYSNGQFSLLFYVSTFFGWGLGLSANPQYAVRILAARDHRTTVRMILISALLLLMIYFACLITGLGARVIMPSAPLNSPDEVLPYFSKNFMNTIFGCVVLISIISAAVSTANSQLLIIASSAVHDIYRNLIDPGASEEKLLLANRLAIVLGGSLALLLALNPPMQLLIFGSYIWGVVAVTFLAPLIGGLFLRRPSFLQALTSVTGGLLTILIWFAWFATGPVTINLHPAMPGVIVSVVLYLGIGYCQKAREQRL
ncbi:MAG: sodium:solute symporter family protein [Peptococcaceae bacterium]|nr:sodium:solute symporter family protein [Peptococcaceae bacterium]